MRTYDFSPLFRSTIGFDRLFDLAETAQRATDEGYPPYNIERLADDRYQITLAVAGFSPDEISITAEQNVVTIEGGKTEKTEREFLYSGHLDPAFQAAIQPGGLCPGEGRDIRQRLAQDRAGPGNPRGHEAAADRHQRRIDRRQRPSDRGQGGLIHLLQDVCRASPDARHRTSSKNGGDHAADDRFRSTMFSTSTRCCIPAPCSIIQGRRGASLAVDLPRSAPSWRPGHPMHPRSLHAPRCGRRQVSRPPSRSTKYLRPSANSTGASASAGRQAHPPALY